MLFLPYVVWSFHRFGQLSFRRIIGWAAVCVYFTGLAVYTLVPFPEDPQAFCASTHVGYNLHPLEFITDIRTQTAGMGLRSALTSAVVLQVVFNVVLFVPLGVLLHRYFRRGAITSTLIGLIMSVCIETTQYTGFFGLLPCAYRVADVDDVITNTAGKMCIRDRPWPPPPATTWCSCTAMVTPARCVMQCRRPPASRTPS